MRRQFETAPRFRPLTEADATVMLGWHYEGPYSRYDSRPEDLAGLLDPAHAYHAVEAPAGELLGFCCFGADARVSGGEYQDASAVDVGGGLRPDLTGKGLGIAFLRAILEFARQRFGAATYRVTIAAFNQRAIRMCRWAGFEPTERFTVSHADGDREFVVLTKRADDSSPVMVGRWLSLFRRAQSVPAAGRYTCPRLPSVGGLILAQLWSETCHVWSLSVSGCCRRRPSFPARVGQPRPADAGTPCACPG